MPIQIIKISPLHNQMLDVLDPRLVMMFIEIFREFSAVLPKMAEYVDKTFGKFLRENI